MDRKTRTAYEGYCAQLAQINGVGSVASTFAIEPTVEQKLEDRIQEKAAFLGEVNVVGVGQQSGQVLGLGIASPVAGRTDTALKDRAPRSVHSLNSSTYLCRPTAFDSFISYQHLDAWAKFPDFQARVRDHVTRQIARDRLMIGWNGTEAAATTDLAAHPMLQDVNVGWLQTIRANAPERTMTGIKVGAGGDYATLDGAVFDAAENLLDDWYKDSGEIVAIVGRSLLSDKYLGLIEAKASTPTEAEALKTMMLGRMIGGRKAVVVPYFPATSILITSPKNLSIYWQTGSRRRAIQDNPKRDRIEDYQSVNEAYVIEDFGACAFIDGLLQPNGAGGWA